MFRSLMDGSTATRRLFGLILVAAVAGCADSRITAPGAVLADLGKSANLVVDPLDPLTETHDFNEVPASCLFGDMIPNPYEGLTFESTPYLSGCDSPNGTVAVLPSNPQTYGSLTELVIDLPRAAVAASLDVYNVDPDLDVTLNAYDASGAMVASASDATRNAWATLTVSGDIQRLGIASNQGNAYLDNLSITYAPTAPTDPTDADQCRKSGWQVFGFKNQGQCVRFVETGKDSR
jgi:hypothetical protein